MQHITEQQANFLKDAEEGGLVAEFADRREEANDAKRKQCCAELKEISVERERAMPQYIKAQRTAEQRVQETQARAAEASLQCDAVTRNRMGMDASFDQREWAKRKRLTELAPEILTRTDRKLSRLADLLNGELYFRAITLPAPGGYGAVMHHQSNLSLIEPLLTEIKAKRALLAEMPYTPVNYATIEESCAAVLKSVREKTAATALIASSILAEILSDEAAASPAPRRFDNAESLAERMPRAAA